MRHLREIVNLFAYLLLLGSFFIVFYLLRDVRMGQQLDTQLAVISSLGCVPYLALLASGWALSANFFTELVFGSSGSAQQRSFPREKALAREGKGKDAAMGLLWRDRFWGDPDALWAVLEMARLDPSLGSEAVQAATRLIGSSRTSPADRDHAGRLLQQAKVSQVKPVYEWR